MENSEIVYEAMSLGNYHYFIPDESMAILLIQQTHREIYFLLIYVDDEEGVLLIQSQYGAMVPPEYRNEIAELIARLNNRIRLGNFGLDLDNGIVTFEYAVDVEDGELVPSMILRAIALVIAMLDTYRDGFTSVLYRNTTPEMAMQQMIEEKSDDTESNSAFFQLESGDDNETNPTN